MVDYQNAPSITRHSSDTMEGTTERPLAAIDIPDKIDAEKAAAVEDRESYRDPEEKEDNDQFQLRVNGDCQKVHRMQMSGGRNREE